MYKTIKLTEAEMNACIQFSASSAETQQPIEFGQSDTAARSIKEIARDNLIGKMAEVAVARMLREDFGLHIPVNYEIYPRGEWDDCDIQLKAWNVDIKSTRIGSWLLFEWHKLRIRAKQENSVLPDAIFMCKTPWDMKNDTPVGTVELIGSISLKTLLSPSPKVKVLKKGDFIPNTSVRLQADNYGVHFNDLNQDWDSVIKYMINNSPPDISTLKIP